MKRSLLALLLTVLLLLPVTVAFADDSMTPEEAARGCVYIEIDLGSVRYTGCFIGVPGEPVEYFIMPSVYWSIGEEFFGYIVMEDFDTMEYFFADDDESSENAQRRFEEVTRAFKVEYVSEEADFAICRLDSPITERIPLSLMSTKRVKCGDTVYAISLTGAPESATITRGTITLLDYCDDPAGARCLKTDIPFLYEDRPTGVLVTAEGYVVGIDARYAAEDETRIYSNIDYVMEWLDKNGIAYSAGDRGASDSLNDFGTNAADGAIGNNPNSPDMGITGDQDTSDPLNPSPDSEENVVESAFKKRPTLLYVCIACSVIVLVLAVVVLVHYKNRRVVKQAPATTHDPTPIADSTVEKDSLFYTPGDL